MGRTAIRCSCGQRIGQREVMHAGYYPRMFGPSFVLVRYRCSRCKKMGEKFVKQEEWESGILRDAATEATSEEANRFLEMGPIRMSELASFHRDLEGLADLESLRQEFGGGNVAEEDSH